MRLSELLRAESVEADDQVSVASNKLVEEKPVGSLNPEQARKRQEKNGKKLRRAAEITQTAASRAAEIRADIS